MIVVHGPAWGPLKCPACDGEGELPVRLCHHDSACPCPDGSTECPDCKGRGTVTCTICGEFDAVTVDGDGDEICALCHEAEMDEVAAD
jgi:hypothetical protein